MKVTHYLLLALLLSAASATSALALPVNRVLTVQLATVSATGQVAPFRSISVTTDASGKVAFTFANVPTSDSAPFLMVRIIDGTAVLRQSVVAAPAPNGTANVGVSEVTTSQATAMLKAFADSGGGNATLAAMIMTMVRSGAITNPDLLNLSPLARAAANAFESFLSSNGAAGQLAAFRANLLPAMRDFAATYKDSVDTVALANDASTANPIQDLLDKAASNQREAAARGDAIARFLGAFVNAGADAGISPALMHMAFTEAGKAVEATVTPVSSDVVTAMLAAFRTGAEHCQLRAQMRSYAAALPFMNATTATRRQLFTTAAATLGDALVTAQESYELIYADPGFFPTLQDIDSARESLNLTLQSVMANFITDTTASPGEIIAMQMTMASGMAQAGGIMANMSTSTLQRQGIGKMFTSATASSQNWLDMMVTGANFVTPAIQLTYSSAITNLASNFPQVAVPNFSLFADPYKSLLRLQFDLMLLKFNNQLSLSLAVQPITQADLATIKEADLANRTTVLSRIGGSLNSDQKNALMVVMSQPELL
ncbi:MAG TPA: hypothetical protein VI298_08210 [Geobacteraceae bacterium]